MLMYVTVEFGLSHYCGCLRNLSSGTLEDSVMLRDAKVWIFHAILVRDELVSATLA